MRKRWVIPAAVVVLVLSVGTVAVAAIPNARGGIHACRAKGIGILRVIDRDSGERCTKHEQALSWAQTGRRGPAGPPGNPGPPGPQGPTGVAGYEVVNGQVLDVPANDSASAGATCPPGKLPVGGGYVILTRNGDAYDHPVSGSFPQGDHWRVVVQRAEVAIRLYATAVCATVA